MLAPDDLDTKTGPSAINILREKHPEIQIPDLEQDDWHSFEVYAECLNSFPVDCSIETVVTVMAKIIRGGTASPSGVDALILKN